MVNSAAPLSLVILVAAEGSRTVAEASPPAADAHEQMANSEFATSIPTFAEHRPSTGAAEDGGPEPPLPSYLVLPFSITIVLAAEWSGARSRLPMALWWHLCWDCPMRLPTINDEGKTYA